MKRDNGQHSFIRLDYAARGFVSSIHISIRVRSRRLVYFLQGFTTTPYQIDEIGATLSVFVIVQQGVVLGKIYQK